MSERIPCPACGSENGPEAQACRVCDYRLDVETRDSGKCARCGSGLGSGFEFCQICGLRVQSRRRRPVTQSLRLVQRPRSEVGAITPTSTPALPPEALHAGAAARNAGPTTGEAPHAGAAAVKNAASPTGEAPRREVDEGAPQVTSQGPGGHVHGAATGPMPGFPARQVGVPAQEVGVQLSGEHDDAPTQSFTRAQFDARLAAGSQVGPQQVGAPAAAPTGSQGGHAGVEIDVSEPALLTAEDPAVWSPPATQRAATPAESPGPVPAPRRAPGASRLRLVLVQRDGSEGEVVPLGDAPLTIGRWQGDLRFPADEFLDAAHARVDPAPGGVRVADLGTRNGLFVRISRPEVVYPGDRFLLGHHLLRLENIPPAGREQEPAQGQARGFGTPLQAAWGRLVLLGPGGVDAETHYLRHPQVVFGRELGDIVFPADPFVSWQHAQLSMELRGDVMSVVLTDLRSANGTYLRAREDVMLQPGDMFRVGDQIFRVRMH